MQVSATCAIIGTLALCYGSFVIASIFGIAAAANLILAAALKKY